MNYAAGVGIHALLSQWEHMDASLATDVSGTGAVTVISVVACASTYVRGHARSCLKAGL